MDKRVMAAFLSLALGAARADRGGEAKPDSSLRKTREMEKTQAVDLDLSLGLDDEPTPMAPAAPSPRRANWYYWAAAGAAITAGGFGLYWYEDRAKSPGTPIRNEQTFTDEQ